MLVIRSLALSSRLFSFSNTVAPGELIHLAGPNGSGKSSLLALLAGVLHGEGEVLLSGHLLADWCGYALACRRSYLSQQEQRVAGMPVWHYLMLHNVNSSQERHSVLHHYVDALQLRDKLSRPLLQLSGGEWQRVRLAAALFQIDQAQGQLLLLDEPLAGLDVAQQVAFDTLLPPLLARGVSIIMSSHDLNHTLHHAHRVWLLDKGTVVATGTAEAVLVPDRLARVFGVIFRQAEFAGKSWLLPP